MKSKSLNDFCRDHQITRQTAYNEMHRGRLKTIKVGRARRVPDMFEAEWLQVCAVRGAVIEPVDQLNRARSRLETGT